MTQWGSKSLGDQGYSPIEILRYFYGNDMYINVAEEISGIPSSWPGYDLNIGATGEKVRQLQEQLNVIAGDVYKRQACNRCASYDHKRKLCAVCDIALRFSAWNAGTL